MQEWKSKDNVSNSLKLRYILHKVVARLTVWRFVSQNLAKNLLLNNIIACLVGLFKVDN